MRKVKVKNLWLHPAYLDSLTKESCDIALLELKLPLKRLSPANINTKFDEFSSSVFGVDYGASRSADRPDLVSSRKESFLNYFSLKS